MHLKPFIDTASKPGWHRFALILATMFCAGCLGFPAAGGKQKTGFSQSVTDSRIASDRTDRVVSPESRSQGLEGESAFRPLSPSKRDNRQAVRPEAWLVSHRSGTKTNPAESEREKVKTVALRLTANTTSVDRIKICHDPKENEWWITLYEDAGVFVELKQYIWSIYKDRPEPFLVQERVSKDRLEDHLSTAKTGTSCEVLERSDDPPSHLETARMGASPGDQRQGKREVEKRVETRSAFRVAEKPAAPAGSRKALGKTRATRSRTTATSTPDEDERVYRLTSSSPIQSREARRTSQPSSPVEPDFRLASAGTAVMDVAPRGATSLDGVSRIVNDRPAGGAPDTSPRLKGTSEAAQSRSELPTYFVFLYGSEMNYPELMAWLEANGYDPSLLVDATPAMLEGYDFVWNYYSPSRHGGSVNIQPKSSSKIWGLLVECEDRLLEAFDRKEGHPHYYRRGEKRVPVHEAASGKTVFAWLYLARPNKGDRRDIWPTRDYKSRVLEAALFWDFPEDYVRKIRDWPTR